MPRREDERYRNLSGQTPEACTCQDCTDKFLKKRGIKKGNKRGVSLWAKLRPAEKVNRHPVGCSCTSCRLLGSVELSGTNDQGAAGFFKRLFGKR